MRIGVIAARLGGVDGVSLETDKWVIVLKKMGHEISFCTGEVMNGPGFSQMTGKGYKELKSATIIREMRFSDRINKRIFRTAFNGNKADLKEDIESLASEIRSKLEKWADKRKIDLILVQNANAIPMHLPLGIAIGRFIRGRDMPAVMHHHDFFWERKKYADAKGIVRRYMEEYFPFDHYLTRHIVINSLAQKSLLERKGIRSEIIPNVFDYHNVKDTKDRFNGSFRKEFGIPKDALIALAPVRVIPRKDIKTAIRIVSSLQKRMERKISLIVTGYTTDAGKLHAQHLHRLARWQGVDMQIIGSRIGPRRANIGGKRMYTIWDTYPHADLVLYPSLYEGWGNALGEAIGYKLPVVVRRYDVFKTDIEHLGFSLISFDRFSKSLISNIHTMLEDKDLIRKMGEDNLEIAKRELSFEHLEQKMSQALSGLRLLN